MYSHFPSAPKTSKVKTSIECVSSSLKGKESSTRSNYQFAMCTGKMAGHMFHGIKDDQESRY